MIIFVVDLVCLVLVGTNDLFGDCLSNTRYKSIRDKDMMTVTGLYMRIEVRKEGTHHIGFFFQINQLAGDPSAAVLRSSGTCHHFDVFESNPECLSIHDGIATRAGVRRTAGPSTVKYTNYDSSHSRHHQPNVSL